MGPVIPYIMYALTVASIVYSYMQNRAAQKRFKKQQEEAERNADKAKGFQLVMETEASPLYIPYGRCKAGGTRAYAKIFGSVSLPGPAAGGQTFRTLTSGAASKKGGKNEFLIVQQAISIAGFNRVVAVDIDDYVYTDDDLKSSVCINVYPNGNVADPLAYVNDATRTTAQFTNVSYATGIFKIDRDDPQYNSVPNMYFYIEGMKVRNINRVGNTYNVDGEEVYSNNPARCLLDYLTAEYGKNLSLDEINLQSFYTSKIISDKLMQANAAKSGKFWDANSDNRNINRFETNLPVATDTPIRDNIEKILDSMDLAELIWTEGQYKLITRYPLVYTPGLAYALDDLVQVVNNDTLYLYRSLMDNNLTVPGGSQWANDTPYISDDDLVRGTEISMNWPDANSRFNRVTVRFRNESKNFEDDTVTWPALDSEVYTVYMQEDNNIPLETETYDEATTDYWHALAKAEQRCRFSRLSAIYKFTLISKWTILEPGDLVFLTSNVLKITSELLRISEVKVNTSGNMEIEATRYNAALLAWNAPDTEYIAITTPGSNALTQATNLQFIADNRAVTDSVGAVVWTYADDSRVTKYTVYYCALPIELINSNTDWTELGVTSNNYFSIQNIPAGYYTIAVASTTSSGRLASRWGQTAAQRWPMISVGVGAVIDGSVAMFAATVYRRSATVPATPTGGEFNFAALTFTSPPSGWSVTIPSGALPLYRSVSILKSTDTEIIWSLPEQIADNATRVELTNPVLSVHQDAAGANISYEYASGNVVAYLNGVNVTLNGSTNYSIVAVDNCYAQISNSGADKGKYAVTQLIGNKGSFQIKISFGGQDFYRSISVYGMYTGYQVDTTPPPAVTGATITVGYSTVFIELDQLQVYGQGNGHKWTEIYSAEGEEGEVSYLDATYRGYFEGTFSSFGSTMGTPLRIWLCNRSKDGYLSDPIGGPNGFDATTGKIQTGDIETKAIKRALIDFGAVGELQVEDGAIVNAKIGQIIQSTTFNQGITGWRIDKDGVAEFNQIKVYDGAGHLVLDAGGMQWNYITGANKPADGATRNVNRGEWALGVLYAINDIVLKDGSSWYSRVEHTSSILNQPPTLPTTSNSYWGLYASSGASGSPAESYYIQSSANIISKSGSVLSPANFVVSAYRKLGLSDPTTYLGRFRIYINGNLVYSSASDESSVIYTPASSATNIGIELYSAGGFTVKLDTLQIPIVSAGDGITTVLSNEAHVMSADSDGVVDSYIGSGTTIRIYEGASELSFTTGVATAGQYSLSAATVSPSGAITPGLTTLVDSRAVILDHSAMTQNTCQISYTATIKRFNGSSLTLPLTQSLSKSLRGAIGNPGPSGASAVIAVLSNEMHTVPATNDGTVTSWVGASTSIAIYIGATNDTANWSITPTPSGITGTYDSINKIYTATGMSGDTGYVDFTCTKENYSTQTKRFTITKSKAGPQGNPADAALITLTSNGQAFTFVDNTANPAVQQITFAAVLQNTTGDAIWSTSPSVPLVGTGNSRVMNLSDFGTNLQVVVTVTLGGLTDSLTVVRLDRSTAAAGASASSNNLLPNSTFTLTTTPWTIGYTNNPAPPTRIITRDFVNPPSGLHTIYFANSAIDTTTGSMYDLQALAAPMACVENKRYEFSTNIVNANCSFQVYLLFYDSSGSTIYAPYVSYAANYANGNPADTLSAYKLVGVFGVAPAGAVKVMPFIRVINTANWWAICLCQPHYGEATADQTAFSSRSSNIYQEKITSSNVGVYMENAAITNAVIGNEIYSSNFVSGVLGWYLNKSGNMELNQGIYRGGLAVKSAATGARVEIYTNVIKVFDANGTLRVRMGNLDV